MQDIKGLIMTLYYSYDINKRVRPWYVKTIVNTAFHDWIRIVDRANVYFVLKFCVEMY